MTDSSPDELFQMSGISVLHEASPGVGIEPAETQLEIERPIVTLGSTVTDTVREDNELFQMKGINEMAKVEVCHGEGLSILRAASPEPNEMEGLSILRNASPLPDINVPQPTQEMTFPMDGLAILRQASPESADPIPNPPISAEPVEVPELTASMKERESTRQVEEQQMFSMQGADVIQTLEEGAGLNILNAAVEHTEMAFPMDGLAILREASPESADPIPNPPISAEPVEVPELTASVKERESTRQEEEQQMFSMHGADVIQTLEEGAGLNILNAAVDHTEMAFPMDGLAILREASPESADPIPNPPISAEPVEVPELTASMKERESARQVEEQQLFSMQGADVIQTLEEGAGLNILNAAVDHTEMAFPMDGLAILREASPESADPIPNPPISAEPVEVPELTASVKERDLQRQREEEEMFSVHVSDKLLTQSNSQHTPEQQFLTGGAKQLSQYSSSGPNPPPPSFINSKHSPTVEDIDTTQSLLLSGSVGKTATPEQPSLGTTSQRNTPEQPSLAGSTAGLSRKNTAERASLAGSTKATSQRNTPEQPSLAGSTAGLSRKNTAERASLAGSTKATSQRNTPEQPSLAGSTAGLSRKNTAERASLAGSTKATSQRNTPEQPSLAGSTAGLSRKNTAEQPSLAGSTKATSHRNTPEQPSLAGSTAGLSRKNTAERASLAGSTKATSQRNTPEQPSLAGSTAGLSRKNTAERASLAGSTKATSQRNTPEQPSLAGSTAGLSRKNTAERASLAGSTKATSQRNTPEQPSLAGSIALSRKNTAEQPSLAGSTKVTSELLMRLEELEKENRILRESSDNNLKADLQSANATIRNLQQELNNSREGEEKATTQARQLMAKLKLSQEAISESDNDKETITELKQLLERNQLTDNDEIHSELEASKEEITQLKTLLQTAQHDYSELQEELNDISPKATLSFESLQRENDYLKTKLETYPLLFSVQSEEKHKRVELLTKWARHQEGVEKAFHHLKSAYREDLKERINYSRMQQQHQSPPQPVSPRVAAIRYQGPVDPYLNRRDYSPPRLVTDRVGVALERAKQERVSNIMNILHLEKPAPVSPQRYFPTKLQTHQGSQQRSRPPDLRSAADRHADAQAMRSMLSENVDHLQSARYRPVRDGTR